ncbi:putative uncharacterized protein DDB_G0282133 isoform X2 [Folsomia candida]|uniref:putative uncharacterized protein DDB_G0282133 isoform X2 n=1 Tax=Folsomia candida TaxID=158441 RepID=UPI00160509B7|nr:putative uncharacterized protein DDB_G0282133 isoform X2 [Folsomia candida]
MNNIYFWKKFKNKFKLSEQKKWKSKKKNVQKSWSTWRKVCVKFPLVFILLAMTCIGSATSGGGGSGHQDALGNHHPPQIPQDDALLLLLPLEKDRLTPQNLPAIAPTNETLNPTRRRNAPHNTKSSQKTKTEDKLLPPDKNKKVNRKKTDNKNVQNFENNQDNEGSVLVPLDKKKKVANVPKKKKADNKNVQNFENNKTNDHSVPVGNKLVLPEQKKKVVKKTNVKNFNNQNDDDFVTKVTTVKKKTKNNQNFENKDDDSVPVVPIQLPPPNATLHYHYTDDPTSSLKNLMKTDFSKIILPFKTTQKDVRNPSHYRDQTIFFQDFDNVDDEDGHNFDNDFNLYTEMGDDNDQSVSAGTQIQKYSKSDTFLHHHHNNDNNRAEKKNSSQNAKSSSHIKKTNSKRKIMQPQNRNNFFTEHDYPQISHDDSTSFSGGGGGGFNNNKNTATMRTRTRQNNKNNNNNNYDEQLRRNKNKNSTTRGKSDSFLVVGDNKSEKNNDHYFGDYQNDNDSDDDDELGEDFFESKKISGNFYPKKDNASVGTGFGSSLEDVSLSLNFDNGRGTEGGEDSEGRDLTRRRRPRRSVVHLYDMVVCATGCNPLAYKGYGCYCGFLGSGLTVDGIDRCCAKHDWCYHHAKCPPFLTYFVPYYWTCNDGRPRCVTEYRGWKGVCGANLCECDRQFAQCLRKYPCPRSRAMCMTSPLRNLPGPNFFFLA